MLFECTNPECQECGKEKKGTIPTCKDCGRNASIIKEGKKSTEKLKKESKIEPQEEVTIEFDLDGFDVNKVIKKTVKEFVDQRGMLADEYLKEIIKDAVADQKPTVINIPERPQVTITGRVHKKFEECLLLTQVERQLFVCGPAGSGKTTLGLQLSKALSLDFAQISCSGGLSEAHLLGRMLFDGTYVSSDLVRLYENGGVFLFDEIDAADANTLLVINSGLANDVLSVPNRKDNNHAKRHKDFVCICAGNTWGTGSFEYQGRNHLDAAFLDRFCMSKVEIDYDEDLEREICGDNDELFHSVLDIRNMVKELQLKRVVSTRAFISGMRQIKAGKTLKKVLETLFVGWSDQEKAKIRDFVKIQKAKEEKQEESEVSIG